MGEYRCTTCDFAITSPNCVQNHYTSEWHRFNVKRRVTKFSPLGLKQFEERMNEFQQIKHLATKEKGIIFYCQICRKNFKNKNAYENHEQSKKHKYAVNVFQGSNSCADFQIVEKRQKTIRQRSENEEETDGGRGQSGLYHQNQESDNTDDDSSSYEIIDSEEIALAVVDCLFCDQKGEDITENLKHMSVQHSFFIPDIEYCTDIEGLLGYLAEKVANYYMCLWCNDRGKTFYTLNAARKHMIDKGHCQMLHEGDALAEYVDFYDYSSTYPDHKEGMDIDEEYIPELLDGDEHHLVLPSGAVIGHRLLLRKNKQRLNAQQAITAVNRNCKLNHVLNHYRTLGWTQTDQEAAARKARDIHVMKRVQSKWRMKLGIKANKLQKHYRAQVLV